MKNSYILGGFGLLGLLASCAEDEVGLTPAFTQNPATVFINELHYNNIGTDAGEAVEIAGPAGTDLTGWRIVRYNGSGGVPYTSPTANETLNSVLPNTSGGYGFVTVSYPANGIQNGLPDGLALIDETNEVVQFLSYGGTFTAVGGLADGRVSTPIGVAEPDATPVGFSLQLSGSGTAYQDFTWAAFDDSFGAVNAGQTFLGGPTADVAPTVSSVTPTPGATGVALTSDVVVTFSEPVSVIRTGVALACGGSAVEFTGSASEDSSTYTLEPDPDFARAGKCVFTIAASAVTDRDGTPDTLSADYTSSFTTIGAVTKIHEVQGDANASPLAGSSVTVEGVVVGDFEGPSPALRGFYIQEERPDHDADETTSEGIFVFNNNADSVSTGQTVSVTGRVSEAFGLTQITASATEVLAPGAVAEPTELGLPVPEPVAGVPYHERFEGMLVTFAQPLVISEYFNYDRFGEIALAQPQDGLARLYTPTSYAEPGSEAQAIAELTARSRITLDDGLGASNPEVTRHPNGRPFSLENRFRGGDTVTDTVGVLDYRFNLYRVQPTQGAAYAPVNLRTPAPDPVGGNLKVASFNVLNYFTTFGANDRGANNPTEFERQQAKIVAALKAIDANVFGLIEIQNNGDTAVQALVDALNNAVGAGAYSFIPTGTIGTDAIKVALIYKPATVTPVGTFEILNSLDDSRFIDTLNRPALVQTFDEVTTGGRVTVAVNHLKSKGSDCNSVNDPDTGDGQGNCNVTRIQAAAALVDFLATDPTGSGDPDVLVVGDLNAYDEEDPIRTLETAGYIDLNEKFGGEFAYSYVFDAQAGYLDYALSSPTLTDQVTGTTDWHINADEPDLLDYDTSSKSAGQDALYAPDPYRSSDHDPVVVGLALTPPDPRELLADLSAEVAELGLGRGDAQSLLAQLETAQRQLGRGRNDQAGAALTRFESRVAQLVGEGRLGVEQGQALTEDARTIRDLL